MTHLFALFLSVLLVGHSVLAQEAAVTIDIQREFLGLGGVIQRGAWTPIRVDLTHTGTDNIEVHCRWLLTDEDGDALIAERRNITLQPLRQAGVWLYATPPMSTKPGQTWLFQAIDAQSGELLSQVPLELSENVLVEPWVNLVGVCGFKDMGLTPWLRWSTHHEPLQLVRGLDLQTLPDRWYGLDSLSSLVWTPDAGGSPTDPRMSDSSKRALREWVYRGGHLVVVLPYAGQPWTGADSGLADLLDPIDADAIRQARASAPISVFGVLQSTEPIALNWFDLSEAPGYTALAEVDLATSPPGITATPPGPNPAQPDMKPIIVGKRFGFGQVTLVGLDLSNAEVLTVIDAFRLYRVWTRIYSWRASKTGELLPNSELDNPQLRGQYWEAKDATKIELGNWLAGRVAREGQTGPAIGLAFVLFILYAVFAALTFPNLLKARGWHRHSWTLFVCIVAVFSTLAWGGAWFMRPATTSVAHFTVLDIDGNNNLVHARSWQSLLIPTFATAEVQVASEADGLARMEVVNLLASPGHELSPDSPGYPDQRSYTFNAADPGTVPVPMRSTTKSLKIDFLGQITGQQPGLARPWPLPQASLRMNNGIPVGTITHDLPGELTDVRVIYCPGGPQQPAKPGAIKADHRPLVYEYKVNNAPANWPAGTPLALPNTEKAYSPLWVRPRRNTTARIWNDEGYLGQAIASRGFIPGSGSSSNVIEDLPLLTFFGALPPPLYETQTTGLSFGGMTSPYNVFNRSMVRDLDLTHLITGRRIILIGHLRDSPSPVPLTVDGQAIPSKGWTVVRWIYDL